MSGMAEAVAESSSRPDSAARRCHHSAASAPCKTASRPFLSPALLPSRLVGLASMRYRTRVPECIELTRDSMFRHSGVPCAKSGARLSTRGAQESWARIFNPRWVCSARKRTLASLRAWSPRASGASRMMSRWRAPPSRVPRDHTRWHRGFTRIRTSQSDTPLPSRSGISATAPGTPATSRLPAPPVASVCSATRDVVNRRGPPT